MVTVLGANNSWWILIAVLTNIFAILAKDTPVEKQQIIHCESSGDCYEAFDEKIASASFSKWILKSLLSDNANLKCGVKDGVYEFRGIEFRKLENKCEEYNYWAPVCLLANFFWFVLGISALFIFICTTCVVWSLCRATQNQHVEFISATSSIPSAPPPYSLNPPPNGRSYSNRGYIRIETY